MERISSRQNPIVKRFRALTDPSAESLLLDGAHLLEEALASGVALDVVAVTDAMADGPAGALARRAEREGARMVSVSESVMAAMSPVRQPSGVIAIGRWPRATIEAALEQAPQMVLILSDVQDPGNVGAIIRAADACGATGIVVGEGTADPFGWKALRGSMGSVFHIPVATRQPLETAIRIVRDRGINLYAAVPRAGRPLPRCQLRRATAVLLGGEGAGLPSPLLDEADEWLTIPMHHSVESLNVATAAALIVYEAQRQRDGTGA
jgi:TrmH family RNA methyltransferase